MNIRLSSEAEKHSSSIWSQDTAASVSSSNKICIFPETIEAESGVEAIQAVVTIESAPWTVSGSEDSRTRI